MVNHPAYNSLQITSICMPEYWFWLFKLHCYTIVQFLIKIIIHCFQSQTPLLEPYSWQFSNNIILYSLKYTKKFINLDVTFFLHLRPHIWVILLQWSNSLYYCHAEIKNIKNVSWNTVKINAKNNLYHQVIGCTMYIFNP